MSHHLVGRRGFLALATALSVGSALPACSSFSPDSKEPMTTASASTDVHGHIVVISTGGTIASTHDDHGALVPSVKGDDLVAPVYDTFDRDKLRIDVRDIASLDSSAMTLADTDMIVQAVLDALSDDTVTGVILTHGTDSMEETAIAIDTFVDSDTPVALTGAMRPFDDPEPDGPDNLTLAVSAVSDPANRGQGAFIVFGDKIIRARGAYKSHTEDPGGFSTNALSDPKRPEPLSYSPLADVRVDIVAAYPGAPGDLITSSIDAGADGIVIEGMGAGNIGDDLAKAAEEAAADGIPVLLSTRVDAGPVESVYGGAGGGATLGEHGILGTGILRAGQARILLAAAIATGTDVAELL